MSVYVNLRVTKSALPEQIEFAPPVTPSFGGD